MRAWSLKATTKQLVFALKAMLIAVLTAIACNAYTLDEKLAKTNTIDINSASQSEVIARAYILRSSDPAAAKTFLSNIDIEKLNQKDKDIYDLTQAYLFIMSGDLDGAISAYEKLTDNARSFEVRFSAYAGLAALNSAVQNWSAAFDALDFVTDNIDNVSKQEVKEQAHSAVINFYNLIDESETVISYATPILKEDYGVRFKCIMNMQLIVAKVTIKDTSLSQESFDEAISFCEEAKEPVATYAVHSHHARYLFNNEQIDKALNILLEQLDGAEAIQYTPVIDEYYAFLGEIYYRKDDYKSAKKYVNLIVENKTVGNYVSKADITSYQVLYQIAEHNKQYQQALEFHKLYAKAKSLNISNENAKMLNIQKARQDSIEKSNKIMLLNSENSLLRAQALLGEEADNNRQLVIALLSVVIVVIIFWIYKTRSHYFELKEISRKDALTGIANRHFFTLRAQEIIKDSKHDNTNVSMIMFDLDDFKKINDKYGHKEGDTALKNAVNATREACRKLDLIGRLGGEEFAIILPGCDLNKAIEIAQKCRQEIDNTNISLQQSYKLSASFGVASSETCTYDFDKLYDNADQALYRAKESGKNKVCH